MDVGGSATQEQLPNGKAFAFKIFTPHLHPCNQGTCASCTSVFTSPFEQAIISSDDKEFSVTAV